VAFLLTVFFFYHGLRHGNWTFCLLGFACFGVGAFMLVDRLLQRGKRPVAKDPLKTCIEGSLFQVNHQIWLLKNILWWYLSPFVAAWGISVGVSIWQLRHVGLSAVIGWGICILIYWGVYRLNQIAVRKDLEPRRQELEALLASLD